MSEDTKCVECNKRDKTPCGLCMTCAKMVIDGGDPTTVKGKIVASVIRNRIEKMFADKQ